MAAADMPPLCKTCTVNRVRHRIDRGPRKGEWRDNCSRRCGAISWRGRSDQAKAGLTLRAANRQRILHARQADLRQVFGDLLDDRRRMVSVEQAVALALRYGQLRRNSAYKAGYQRATVRHSA